MPWEGLSGLIRHHVQEGPDGITLRRVRFLDMRGPTLLVVADRLLCDEGGEFVLRRPSRAVRHVLPLLGSDALL